MFYSVDSDIEETDRCGPEDVQSWRFICLSSSVFICFCMIALYLMTPLISAIGDRHYPIYTDGTEFKGTINVFITETSDLRWKLLSCIDFSVLNVNNPRWRDVETQTLWDLLCLCIYTRPAKDSFPSITHFPNSCHCGLITFTKMLTNPYLLWHVVSLHCQQLSSPAVIAQEWKQ